MFCETNIIIWIKTYFQDFIQTGITHHSVTI